MEDSVAARKTECHSEKEAINDELFDSV